MRRWVLVVVVVMVGLVGVLIGAGLAVGVDRAQALFAESGPGLVSGTCDGASFDVTVAPGPGDGAVGVTVQVVIFDDAGRGWRVRWPGWGMSADAVPSDVAHVSHAFQVLGDLDDGDDRRVWLRPVTSEQWCKVTGSLG